ncbi:hypothetical protein LCGC14_3000080, partial [marine sediment metagenome]
MRTLFLSLIVSIPILFSQCGQKEDPHELYSQADSMLGLTMHLQSRIGSPGIKRLHDFEDEIILDLAVLSLLPEEDTTLAKYLELHNGLAAIFCLNDALIFSRLLVCSAKAIAFLTYSAGVAAVKISRPML